MKTQKINYEKSLVPRHIRSHCDKSETSPKCPELFKMDAMKQPYIHIYIQLIVLSITLVLFIIYYLFRQISVGGRRIV